MIKTICCSNCGYTYTRSLKKESYQYIFYVKIFGPVWIEKLQDLYRQKLSIRKIAKILGCSTQAVKNQIAKLFNNATSLSEADKKTIQLKQKRAQWIRLKRENAQLTKTQLGHLQPNLLVWLMRNDRLWLDSLSYTKYSKVGSHKIIDWKKREEYYINYVKEVFQQHFLLEEKKRITVSLLLAYIPQKGKITHNINKMPKLKEYLSSVSETPEEYKLRLLEIVFKTLSNQNLEINRKVLLQKSKIIKHHLSSAIEEKIQRLLSQLSNSGLCDNRKTGS